jgi:hypothetical protein
VVLNIPLIIIGVRGYSVLSLFLVANLLTTCGLVPIILGLITPLRGFVTETGALPVTSMLPDQQLAQHTVWYVSSSCFAV